MWRTLDGLPADERLTVMLRYFTRSESYAAIARLTAVPVGTVRSRLNRARSRLADALRATVPEPPERHADVEADRRAEWEDFYRTLHHPAPRTYRDLFIQDVDVRDPSGHWVGLADWSAHEREAITLGVRATIIDLLASRDLTVIEIDFKNPPASSRHCPPHATFVHSLRPGPLPPAAHPLSGRRLTPRPRFGPRARARPSPPSAGSPRRAR